MTKSDFRKMVREVIQEELSKTAPLKEAVEGATYVIKAWDAPDKNGFPKIDTAKSGKRYDDFDDVLAALNTSELAGKGAYEITWIKSGEEIK